MEAERILEAGRRRRAQGRGTAELADVLARAGARRRGAEAAAEKAGRHARRCIGVRCMRRAERLVDVERQVPQAEADFTPPPAEPHPAVPPGGLDAVTAGAFRGHAAHRDRQLGLEAHVEPVAEILSAANADVRARGLRAAAPILVDVGLVVGAAADIPAADRTAAAQRCEARVGTSRLRALDGHAQAAIDLHAAALGERGCRSSERGRDSNCHHFLLHWDGSPLETIATTRKGILAAVSQHPGTPKPPLSRTPTPLSRSRGDFSTPTRSSPIANALSRHFSVTLLQINNTNGFPIFQALRLGHSFGFEAWVRGRLI